MSLYRSDSFRSGSSEFISSKDCSSRCGLDLYSVVFFPTVLRFLKKMLKLLLRPNPLIILLSDLKLKLLIILIHMILTKFPDYLVILN